jgi:DNA-dependent RNA polymerase auxiliary subunit epsilon
MKDDFIFLPVYSADKGRLLIEAKYNFEYIKTLSGWIGYNLTGGKCFE